MVQGVCPTVVKGPRKLARKAKEFWLFSIPHLPSCVTICALASSLSSIYFALNSQDGDLSLSIGCIWLSGFLDTLDGRLARYLNACSEFGAELDSLADLISFGVCPSVCIYLTQIAHAGYGFWGWAPVLVWTAAMAIRLARFNVTHTGEVPPYAVKFFTGVPAPAGSFLMMSPYYFLRAGVIDAVAPRYWCIHMTLCSLFLVSNVRTFSNKIGEIKKKAVMPYLTILVMAVVGYSLFFNVVWWDIWIWLVIVIIAYIMSVPVGHCLYLRMRREWDEDQKKIAEKSK